jgi:hypothetical protein
MVMTKSQIDQYDMVLSTEKCLIENEALYADNAPLMKSKAIFSAKITELAAQIALQLINTTGLTEDKSAVRQRLEDTAFVLGAAGCGYASAIAHNDLYNRCYLTKTGLTRFKDTELVGICTDLQFTVTINMEGMAPFGISEAAIVAFKELIEKFMTVMKNPTEGIAKRATATANIARLLPEIMELLNTRLDNNMVIMSLLQPDFYSTYTNVRQIISSPTSVMSLTTTVLDEVDQAPVANVKIEIVGENIHRTSSPRGYNTIINLTEGNHKLTTSHPNYATQTVDFTVVSGETTELLVLLKKAGVG